MKLDDKNIDQLFRDAAQNKPAPEFQSSYWNEVSSALDIDQRRKKGLVLWSVGGSLALVGILALMFISPNINSSTTRYSQEGLERVEAVQHHFVAVNSNTSENKNDRIDRDYEKGNRSIVSTSDNNADKSINSKNDLSKNTELEKASHNLKESKENSNMVLSRGSSVAENTELQEDSKTSIQPVDAELALTGSNRMNPNALTSTLKIPKEDGFRLSAQLNAGVMENYRTSRQFQSGLFSAGLKASLHRSNLYFASGIGIQVSTNTDLIVSRRAKFYGFGVINYQTDLSYQNMYDVYIPLEIGYRKDKTTFGMGLQASYLINTTMEMSNYEDNELISKERITGYNNGLNKFSAQGYLWINYDLTQRVSVGMRVGTNFTNRIKEGDYFNESAATNPVYGQISIQYHIFK